MADSTIPNLDPVITPASTDLFGVRQSGDTRDKKQTRAQLHSLEAGEKLILDPGTLALPGLAFSGDTDTGIRRTAADQLSLIAGGVQVANLTEVAGVAQFIVPFQNDATNPSIAFGDGDSGFYETSDDVIRVTIATFDRFEFASGQFRATQAAGPAILNETASATNPTIIPHRADTDTGIGRRADDIGVLIAGGLNCIEFGEAAAAPLVAFYGTAAIAKQTGVAVTAAGVHAALVNLGLITA